MLDDYIGRFRRSETCDRMFFICHSPAGTLSVDDTAGVHIWAGDRLADAAVKAGLFDWLTALSVSGKKLADSAHVYGLIIIPLRRVRGKMALCRPGLEGPYAGRPAGRGRLERALFARPLTRVRHFSTTGTSPYTMLVRRDRCLDFIEA